MKAVGYVMQLGSWSQMLDKVHRSVNVIIVSQLISPNHYSNLYCVVVLSVVKQKGQVVSIVYIGEQCDWNVCFNLPGCPQRNINKQHCCDGFCCNTVHYCPRQVVEISFKITQCFVI